MRGCGTCAPRRARRRASNTARASASVRTITPSVGSGAASPHDSPFRMVIFGSGADRARCGDDAAEQRLGGGRGRALRLARWRDLGELAAEVDQLLDVA